MSNPDEIVCESVPKFWGECDRVHRVRLYGLPSREGDSVTMGGVTVVYRPTPPRDEAREAFEKWAEDKKFSPDGWWTASMAFLAGRASVKP